MTLTEFVAEYDYGLGHIKNVLAKRSQTAGLRQAARYSPSSREFFYYDDDKGYWYKWISFGNHGDWSTLYAIDIELPKDLVFIHEMERLVESVTIVKTLANDLNGAIQLYELSKNQQNTFFADNEITVERLEQAIHDCQSTQVKL